MAEHQNRNLPQSTPLVSVVIPVYNARRFLRAALDSVLAQDYPNIEIIAVDDDSADGSLEILEEYSDRIEVFCQANAGSARARNEGINRSSGEYVAFLDADDAWHPSKTRLQVRELESNPDIGLVYNNWIVVHDDANEEIGQLLASDVSNDEIPIDDSLSGWVYCQLLMDSIVHTSSAMIRRGILRDSGAFDETLRKGQDYDLWIRLSRSIQFRKLAVDLSIYRIQDQGVTQIPSDTNYGAAVIESALEKWGRRGPDGRSVPLIDIRSRLAWIWYGFAYLHAAEHNYDIARKAYLKSWTYCPWRIGSLKRYLGSSWSRLVDRRLRSGQA